MSTNAEMKSALQLRPLSEAELEAVAGGNLADNINQERQLAQDTQGESGGSGWGTGIIQTYMDYLRQASRFHAVLTLPHKS